MKTFTNDRYPRGKNYKGTKESLYEAGRLLQKLAENMDEAEKDFRSMPHVIDIRLGSIEALLENVSHDEIFQFKNISLKRNIND